MIDLSQLTPTQRTGLQYACQTANEPIKAANDALPEGATLAELFTEQTYAETRFGQMCDSYYEQLMTAKITAGAAKIASLPPEKQQQIADLLELEDVVKPE